MSKGAKGMNPLNTTDLQIRPLSLTNVPKRIPRNIQSQIVWDVVKLDLSDLSFTTTVVENNVQVTMGSNPQASQWVAIFDQYAIPYFTLISRSRQGPGNAVAPGMIYTALDFDSSGNIGTVANIQDFSSCEEQMMVSGSVVMRSVRPSCKGNVGSTGGTKTAAVDGPVWLDSGATDIPHFGIRSMLGPIIGASYGVQQEVVIYYCFRNTI